MEAILQSHNSLSILEGTTQKAFPQKRGEVILDTFSFMFVGVYLIRIQIQSSDGRFTFAKYETITVTSLARNNITKEVNAIVRIRFQEKYDDIVGINPDLFLVHVQDYFSRIFTDVICREFSITTGNSYMYIVEI